MKYSIDVYSVSWLGYHKDIMGNLDLSLHFQTLPSIVTSSIALVYVLFSLVAVMI